MAFEVALWSDVGCGSPLFLGPLHFKRLGSLGSRLIVDFCGSVVLQPVRTRAISSMPVKISRGRGGYSWSGHLCQRKPLGICRLRCFLSSCVCACRMAGPCFLIDTVCCKPRSRHLRGRMQAEGPISLLVEERRCLLEDIAVSFQTGASSKKRLLLTWRLR